ncbi:MAG: Fe-S cluster assembly protein SufD [Rhodospirillaceae bacterium]
MQALIDSHAPFRQFQPGTALPWLEARRAVGLARAERLGWPTTRLEPWKFTNLAKLSRMQFEPATPASANNFIDVLPTVVAQGNPASHRLVFVNGFWRSDLSSPGRLPGGVTLTGLAATLAGDPILAEAYLGQVALPDDHALAALNTAFLTDGPLLVIGEKVEVKNPIELIMISAGSADQPLIAHPRLIITAGPYSQATVIEHHISLGDHVMLSNAVTELSVGIGAELRHYKVQREHDNAFHLATTVGRLERAAVYEGFLLTLGARLSRNEVRLVLDGVDARARLSGAYLVENGRHADTTTLIEHAKPRGTSRQVFKGVIGGKSRGVFQGKIIVRPDAQKTEGYQLHRALLLTDDARIDAKPELEIYADDVKCSHGATAGDLDDDALFYLRARGIDRDGARALLIGAYVNEVLAEISDSTVQAYFENLAATRLGTDKE